MRFSTLIFAATAMAAVHALTPNQIISSLNDIEKTTTGATILLKDAKASSQDSDAVQKMTVSTSNETRSTTLTTPVQAALAAVSRVAALYDSLNSELVSLATSTSLHFMYADKQPAIAQQTDPVGGEEDALNSADTARMNAAANNVRFMWHPPFYTADWPTLQNAQTITPLGNAVRRSRFPHHHRDA